MTTLVKDTGFLIRSLRYRDHDRILSFLTREHGRIDLIAHGASKSLKRFSGILDFLNLIGLEYQTGSRGGLSRLAEARLQEGFPGIRANYDQTIMVLRWFRILNRALPSEGQVRTIFSLLESCLQALGIKDELWVDLVFRRRLLSALGYHLQLAACTHCLSSRPEKYFFLASRGGLLCGSCVATSGSGKTLIPFPESWWSLEGHQSPWTRQRIQEAQEILVEGFHEYLGIEETEASFYDPRKIIGSGI